MLKVVNKHSHKPNQKQKDYYIGRGSLLGNPFTHLPLEKSKALYQVADRDEAIRKYEIYLCNKITVAGDRAIRMEFKKIIDMMKSSDVNLVCFCAPKRCHGDVIKEIIEDMLADTDMEDDFFDNHFGFVIDSFIIKYMKKHNIYDEVKGLV